MLERMGAVNSLPKKAPGNPAFDHYFCIAAQLAASKLSHINQLLTMQCEIS
jgi:hypothetical protein